ncbi:hypothetical protein [Paraferrimonas sp. SM1919]|uniref:hypothetical protein n=1 Tax=Paraferrimonas sp. SM1919 TaxID=2662263 RepID=UPI0013D40426|nr:hypothetical protein [Paraferrimonas sp. SM1919]
MFFRSLYLFLFAVAVTSTAHSVVAEEKINYIDNTIVGGTPSSWQLTTVDIASHTDRTGVESSLFVIRDPVTIYGTEYGVIKQDINIDSSVLDGGIKKAVFGGWHATSNLSGQLTKITLTFQNSNAEGLGSKVLSWAGTGGFTWKKRESHIIIPAETSKITFKVEFEKFHNTKGHVVRFDDAFLYIEPALDVDKDGIEDAFDLDINNDGLVEELHHNTNVLPNSGYKDTQQSWSTSSAQLSSHLDRDGVEKHMFVKNDGTTEQGSISQVVSLNSLGFNDLTNLDNKLEQNALKLVFGGWHTTTSLNSDFSKITVTFKNENNEGLRSKVIDWAGTGGEWKERSSEVLIPSGTRQIEYKVEFKKPKYSDGKRIRFDDGFMYIQPAQDIDLDAVIDKYDLDLDNDGLVDQQHYQTNILKNSSYKDTQENWVTSSAQLAKHKDAGGIEKLMFVKNDGTTEQGSLTQVVSLQSLGFSDLTFLDSQLSDNALKVVFGGWHATSSLNSDFSKITLLFTNSDNEGLGTHVLSWAGTGEYSWRERKGEALIPVGTREITFKVEFKKPKYSDGNRVRFDDGFIYIQPAIDIDLDSVLDEKDIDIDNDGLVDEEHYKTNLLNNANYQDTQQFWESSSSYLASHNDKTGTQKLMYVKSDGTSEVGTLSQSISIQSVGLTNIDNLETQLAAGKLKLAFGGWFATISDGSDQLRISIIFQDKDGNGIGNETIDWATTGDLNWARLSKEALIPSGAATILFQVEFKKSKYSDGNRVRFDDGFVYIQPNDYVEETEQPDKGTDTGTESGPETIPDNSFNNEGRALVNVNTVPIIEFGEATEEDDSAGSVGYQLFLLSLLLLYRRQQYLKTK